MYQQKGDKKIERGTKKKKKEKKKKREEKKKKKLHSK